MLTFSDFKFMREAALLFESVEVTHVQIDERQKITDPNQPWASDPGADKNASEEQVKALYDKAMKLANDAFGELKRGLLKSSGGSAKIYMDIKAYGSFKDKVLNRGKGAGQIHDVLRSAVTVKDDSEVDSVVSQIKKTFRILEHDYKKFGQQGGYGYYGSHHFVVGLSNGILAEVQVMTRKMWTYKERAHEIYTKWRSVKDIKSKDIAAELAADMKLSRDIFVRGNAFKTR